jgi:hypothetical protein
LLAGAADPCPGSKLLTPLCGFTDKASRKLNYEFADLTGIIFGARTATEDKLKIMKIIEDKSRAEKRARSH